MPADDTAGTEFEAGWGPEYYVRVGGLGAGFRGYIAGLWGNIAASYARYIVEGLGFLA